VKVSPAPRFKDLEELTHKALSNDRMLGDWFRVKPAAVDGVLQTIAHERGWSIETWYPSLSDQQQRDAQMAARSARQHQRESKTPAGRKRRAAEEFRHLHRELK